jgi:hypothetical protein
MDIVNKVAQLITDDPNIINENNDDTSYNRIRVDVDISDQMFMNEAICDYMREVVTKLLKAQRAFSDVYQELGFVKGTGDSYVAKISRINREVIERLFIAIQNRVSQVNDLNDKYRIYRFQDNRFRTDDGYKVDVNKMCGYDDNSFIINMSRFTSFCNEVYSFLSEAIDKIETAKQDEGRYGSMQFENRVRS